MCGQDTRVVEVMTKSKMDRKTAHNLDPEGRNIKGKNQQPLRELDHCSRHHIGRH